MFAGYASETSRHLRLACFIQLHDRQASTRAHQAEQTQRIFQGRRNVVRHAGLQLAETPLQAQRYLQPALACLLLFMGTENNSPPGERELE